MRPPPTSIAPRNAAVLGRARPSAARLVALAAALLAPGCAVILGADQGYYEVDGGAASASSSGGAAATTASASRASSSGGAGGAASSSSASATASSSSGGTGGSVNDTCWHGAPADPGGVDPCGSGSIAALSDNFNDDVLGPLWGVYEISATAMETNHAAVVSIPGAPAKFAGFVSKSAYSLLGCHGVIEVVQAPQHKSTVAHVSFSPDPSSGADLVEFRQIDHALAFSLVSAGVATDDCVIPYLPVAHRFWRVRELAGQILWETSPNGQTWTIQRLETAPAFLSAVRVDFGVIPLAADVAGVGIFDNFNAP